jgi:hypothetical protein
MGDQPHDEEGRMFGMSEDRTDRHESEAKIKRERQAREAKTTQRKEHEARAELERKAITAQIKDKRAALEALIRDPGLDEKSSERRIRELKQEITYLGHALYLLKKTGKSRL